MRIAVGEFNSGDTVRLRYNTVRSADEDEPALLDKNKNTNHWMLNTTVKQPCKFTVNTPQATSTESTGPGNLNFDQKLSFFPAVTSLIGPQGGGVGEIANLIVQTDQLMNYWIGNNQIFGCNVATDIAKNCNPQGIIKVKIAMYAGMRLLDIDSSVYFLRATNNTIDTIRPLNFYTLLHTTQCDSGAYFFYWNLDSVLMQTLENGNFFFKVQACCPASELHNHLEVKFYLMPNANNCFTLNYAANHNVAPTPQIVDTNFIPLSSVEHDISIMCPGCLVPGAIAATHRMERKSLGLQDSNNNGLADNGATPITTNTAWYNTFKPLLKTNFSTYGDSIADYLTIYFQDGDDQNGGYTYAQMLAHNAKFHYIQISKDLPGGVSKMGLVPVGATFYIDTNTTGGACVDCGDFYVATNWTTMAVVNLGITDLQNYVVANGDNLLFSFGGDANDSTHINNWHKTYTSSLFPYTNIYANQRYRLLVNYRECGTFDALNKGNALQTAKDVTHKMVVSNKATFSGKKQPDMSHDNYPASYQALHEHGWSIWDSIPPYTLISDTLANSFSFWCQTNGSVHYGVSTDTYVQGWQEARTDSACKVKASIAVQTRTGDAYQDFFPYEYKPCNLFYKQYNYHIPPNVTFNYATQANNLLIKKGTLYSSTQTNITTTIATDTVIVTQAHAVPFSCLTDADSANFNSSTIAYAGDLINAKTFYFYSTAQACMATIAHPNECASLAITDTTSIPCLPVADCTSNDTICNTSNNTNFAVYFATYLHTTVSPAISTPLYDSVCFIINMTNTQNPNTAVGGNLFICIPPSLQANFGNWHFTNAQGQVLYASNGIIQVSSLLGIGAGNAIQGTLCADMIQCLTTDLTANIYTGLDCDGYPTDSASAMLSCDLDTNQFILLDANPRLETLGKAQTNLNYTLCDTVMCDISFAAKDADGFIYPTQFTVTNLPLHFNLVQVAIANCNTNDTANLYGNLGVYNISANQLIQIGLPNAGISQNSIGCLRVQMYFIPECGFEGTTSHIMTLSGQNYCGDPVETTDTSDAIYTWNGLSECNDCFTITKTASTTSINAYDTITYTITVTANNGSPQSVIVSDLLPPNFTLIGTNPFPAPIVLAPQGSQTFTVQGYFTQPNGCDSTMNIATLTDTNNVSISDTVCVEVNIPCFVNGIETLEDSTKASALTNTSFVTFYVDGTLIIDQTTTFYNCHIYVKAGGQIIVNTNMNLILDNTIIEGCGFMWQGIKIDNAAHCEVLNDSWIRDAEIGLSIIDNSKVQIFQSRITDCVKCVYIAPLSGCADISNVWMYVDESEFDIVRPTFLMSYNGQPAHGTKPKAGFELNNVLAQNILIGKLPGYPPNQFKNMNAGIVINNSTLDIYNTTFRNIQPDNFYTEPWNGSAAVSVSIDKCSTTNLKVKAILGIDNIKDCYRGIYTDYSGLEAVGVKILDTYEGVYSTRCPFPRSANVSGCTITASKYGINWEMNVGAMSMLAASNNITVHGNKYGACVRIAELNNAANYKINDNDIYAVEILNGIVCTTVLKPEITYNRVYQNTLGANMPMSEGITLNSSDGAFVSCNHVNANYGYNTTGVVNVMSNSCTITCNNTTNQEYGFFYGGTCANTNMQGNTMQNNYEGLHLNNVASMGIQKHNGNTWVNYYSPFGAVNDNTGNEGLSEFDVHTLAGTQYHPFLNPINTANGWFFYDQFGKPFSCATNFICNAAVANNDPDALEKSIAKDSASSSNYIYETKSINEKYLFERLSNDSALKASSNIYQQFYNSKYNSSIGKLYDIANDLKQSLAYSYSALQNLYLIDSLSSIEIDSLRIIDSLNTLSPLNNYDNIRSQLMQKISNLRVSQETILNQQIQYAGNLQDAAQIKNSIVTTNEIPESNQKLLNEIKFDYYEHNNLAISNNYSQLYSIASQCPYSGGPAVFEARVLLNSLTDTNIYKDEAVCLMQGIFRMQNAHSDFKNQLIVKPNPAQNSLEVTIAIPHKGICSYEIYTPLGSSCLHGKFNCESTLNTIDVSMLHNGTYTLKVQMENQTSSFIKIIILR